MQLQYKLLLHKEDDDRYTVTEPALPGCITYGNNIDHAISKAKEAIDMFKQLMKKK